MKKVNRNVKSLNEDDVFSLTLDSRVVAIRWDLITWGLVFDLDVPLTEGENSLMYRAWLIFKGISQINIPLENTRLPNGLFLTSYINVKKSMGAFEEYSFSALFPTYNLSVDVDDTVTKLITIRAKEVCGIRSIKMANADDFGFLKRSTRIDLANDEEMLNEVNEK